VRQAAIADLERLLPAREQTLSFLTEATGTRLGGVAHRSRGSAYARLG
jgi:hypothetical protein